MRAFLANIDHIRNHFLSVKNYLRWTLFKQREGKDVDTLYDTHELTYEDNFNAMSMAQFKERYRIGQAWGDYHGGDLQQWYDPNGITLDSEGIKFHVTKNTKTVTSYIPKGETKQRDNLEPVTIPYGVGLCSSLNTFEYGMYEWCIKLPKGAALWPAVWISCATSWPPEIDILEAYSDKNGKYGKKLQTNFHCGVVEQGTKYALKAFSHGKFVNHNEYFRLHLHLMVSLYEKSGTSMTLNGLRRKR